MDSYNIFMMMLIVYIAGLVAISWYFNSRQRSLLLISGLQGA